MTDTPDAQQPPVDPTPAPFPAAGLGAVPDGQLVQATGRITGAAEHVTKAGTPWADLTLAVVDGPPIPVRVFPQLYADAGCYSTVGRWVTVLGRADHRAGLLGAAEITVAPVPDHVPCRHRDGPISWDETSWTHDRTGYADCWLTLSPATAAAFELMGNGADVFMVNPAFVVMPPKGKTATKAQPEGDWA